MRALPVPLAASVVVTLFVLPILPASPATAAVIFVPGDYPTIQQAVDASADGDAIVVSAGLYPEIVSLDSRSLDIASTDGAEATTVQALRWVNSALSQTMGGSFTGFTVLDTLVVDRIALDFELSGVTVRGDAYVRVWPPSAVGVGSALIDDCVFDDEFRFEHEDFASGSTVQGCLFRGPVVRMNSELALTVRDCSFDGGDLSFFGEAIGVTDNVFLHARVRVRCDSQNGSITGNRIAGGPGLDAEATSFARLDVIGNEITDVTRGIDYTDDGNGGIIRENLIGRCETGLRIRDDYALVERNVIWECGVGVDLVTGPAGYPHVVRNTIVGCTNEGILWLEPGSTATGTLEGNLVVGNGTGISIEPGNELTLACNDVWGNGGGDWVSVPDPSGSDGNVSIDPLFCQVEADNFALEAASPCRPGNHPDGADCGIIGAIDVACTIVGIEEASGDGVGSHVATALRAWPNPSRGAVTLLVPRSNDEKERTVAIHDVAGRLVARVPIDRGREVVTWDARREDGSPVEAGVYYATLTGSNGPIRIVIVR
jgi:hypothetical protein